MNILWTKYMCIERGGMSGLNLQILKTFIHRF